MSKISELQKFKVCLDTDDTLTKPSKKEIPFINQRLNNLHAELTIEVLAGMVVVPHSRTWVPAEFEGPRSNDTWKSQQVFALDFDSGINLEQALERLTEFGLSCNFCYSTFGSTTAYPKFRVVFVHKNPILNKRHRDEIMNAYIILFPEADKGCKDSARMFFGGKEILFQNYEHRMVSEDLIASADIFSLRGSSKNTKTKRLTKMGINDGSIINIIGSPKNPKIEDVRDFDYEMASNMIKIFNDFTNSIWLTHPQLFGIATNLVHIRGGLKYMKKTMDRTGKYSDNNYDILPYVRKRNYYPMQLQRFSPYLEDHRLRDILTAVSLPRGTVRRTEPFITTTLEIGEKKLESLMKKVKESDDTKIHIIRATPGLGKTENILEWKNVFIGFPDHRLKEEVVCRMKVDCEFTPNVMDYLTEKDKVIITQYYKIGAYLKASRYILTKKKESPATIL